MATTPGTSNIDPHQQNFKNVLWDPMPRKIFNGLHSIDTELAWELCRADITSQLLGPDVYGVPFLDEAFIFEPFAVIGKVLINGKKYLKYLGQFKDLIAPCQNMAQFYQPPQRVNDDYITQGQGRIEPNFAYRISNMKDGIKKGVKILLNDVKAFDIAMNMRVGELRLDFNKLPHLKGIQKIFVIYQTFYSEKMSISVTIGESKMYGRFLETENKKFAHEKKFPIAFSVDRFPINHEGILGRKIDTVGESLRAAPWKRCGICKLPDLPRDNKDVQAAALQGAIPGEQKSKRPSRVDMRDLNDVVDDLEEDFGDVL